MRRYGKGGGGLKGKGEIRLRRKGVKIFRGLFIKYSNADTSYLMS